VKQTVGVNEKNRPVGESHPQAKLTDADVDRMLEMRESGMGWGTLAKIFDVSKSHVRRICLGHKRQLATGWRLAQVYRRHSAGMPDGTQTPEKERGGP
jgi:DNA invertase Pin-like site-specific DNA recombinase